MFFHKQKIVTLAEGVCASLTEISERPWSDVVTNRIHGKISFVKGDLIFPLSKKNSYLIQP